MFRKRRAAVGESCNFLVIFLALLCACVDFASAREVQNLAEAKWILFGCASGFVTLIALIALMLIGGASARAVLCFNLVGLCRLDDSTHASCIIQILTSSDESMSYRCLGEVS